MRTGSPEWIEKILLYEKLLVTTRTTLDRHINAESGIQSHVQQHQGGNILATAKQPGDSQHIQWESQKAHHQAISGVADNTQRWRVLILGRGSHITILI